MKSLTYGILILTSLISYSAFAGGSYEYRIESVEQSADSNQVWYRYERKYNGEYEAQWADHSAFLLVKKDKNEIQTTAASLRYDGIVNAPNLPMGIFVDEPNKDQAKKNYAKELDVYHKFSDKKFHEWLKLLETPKKSAKLKEFAALKERATSKGNRTDIWGFAQPNTSANWIEVIFPISRYVITKPQMRIKDASGKILSSTELNIVNFDGNLNIRPNLRLFEVDSETYLGLIEGSATGHFFVKTAWLKY